MSEIILKIDDNIYVTNNPVVAIMYLEQKVREDKKQEDLKKALDDDLSVEDLLGN